MFKNPSFEQHHYFPFVFHVEKFYFLRSSLFTCDSPKGSFAVVVLFRDFLKLFFGLGFCVCACCFFNFGFGLFFTISLYSFIFFDFVLLAVRDYFFTIMTSAR